MCMHAPSAWQFVCVDFAVHTCFTVGRSRTSVAMAVCQLTYARVRGRSHMSACSHVADAALAIDHEMCATRRRKEYARRDVRFSRLALKHSAVERDQVQPRGSRVQLLFHACVPPRPWRFALRCWLCSASADVVMRRVDRAAFVR